MSKSLIGHWHFTLYNSHVDNTSREKFITPYVTFKTVLTFSTTSKRRLTVSTNT